MAMTYYQRSIYTDGETHQAREKEQLVEIFARWNDKGKFQGSERIALLPENCIHEKMGAVLVLVKWVVAFEA
jgi:hypothetical protein